MTGNCLMKLALSGNKVMAEAGHKTALAILEHVTSAKLLLKVYDEMKAKNSLLRARCASYLQAILTNYPTKLLEKHMSHIEEMVTTAVNDASADTRALGRECFVLYEQVFASRANSLLSKFAPAVQKAVAETRTCKKELLVRSPKDSVNSSFGSKTVYSPRKTKAKPEDTTKRTASLRRKSSKVVPPQTKQAKRQGDVNHGESGGVDLSSVGRYDQSGFEKRKGESCFEKSEEDDVEVALADLVMQAKSESVEEKSIAIEAISKFLQSDEKNVSPSDLKAAINILIEEIGNSNYKVLLSKLN